MSGVRLRHLAFTGPGIEPAELKFADGLNIIYGASNTGKSFTSKSILFMLGAATALPETQEITAYDSVWLGLTLAEGRDVTLFRSTRGGHFRLYEGLHRSKPEVEGTPLQGTHDGRRTDTVSHTLLDAIGLAGKVVVKDANAAKENLSVRLLAPYAIVSEEAIIAEQSPVLYSGQPTSRTFERNLFKLLLTGMDDAAAVTVQKPSERKVAKEAKLELVDEMVAQIDAELGEEPPVEAEVREQLSRLDNSADGLFDRLQDAQSTLDRSVGQRRASMDRRSELQARVDELRLTLERFAKLQEVYTSDLQRLQSLEEGGFMLVAMAGMDCPVCGAPPEAQRHNHAAEEIELAHRAAAAESRKIEVELRELGQTTASLAAEGNGLLRTIGQLDRAIDELDDTISEARTVEVSVREVYQNYASTRATIQSVVDLFDRRAALTKRRQELAEEPTRREGDAPAVGPDSTVAFKFGETVKKVLMAWGFPDADKVQFDLATNDITVAGKPRAANGKGVRAILHAAFNVALAVYCSENELPHPGLLVLDTPLLTYRAPMKSQKHGELSEDERALAATGLAELFYRHLASLKNDIQIVVVENSDPPAGVEAIAHVEVFTGLAGSGRFGLLAPAR